jgi:hypothetical protein
VVDPIRQRRRKDEPKGEGHWATDLKLSRGRSACCLPIGAVWQAAGASTAEACSNLLGTDASCVGVEPVERC